MPYAKGESGNPKGRPPGVPNKTTITVKAVFLESFEQLGGVPALVRWAHKHPSEYYRLYSRLLPIDVNHAVELDFAEVLKSARERVANGKASGDLKIERSKP